MNTEPDSLHRRASSVPIDEVPWSILSRKGIQLFVRRDDLIDQHQSGNKLYKLFYNLAQAKQQGFTQVLSYGGAYSNHLYALAAAGHEAGMDTIGIVRGERPAPSQLSPTLRDAEAWGMRLCFVARADYRSVDQELLVQWRATYGDFYAIPEGGANDQGVTGATVIGWAIEKHLSGNYDYVCVPCGTGSTLAGIAYALPADKIALGFSVLKGEGHLGESISRAYKGCLRRQTGAGYEQPRAENWRLITGYHAGGYARKLPAVLTQFWREFEAETGILLDPVYSLKMFWGIAQLARQGYWRAGTRIVAVHTGGLQGRRGFESQGKTLV